MWKETAAACVLALLVSSQPSSGQSGCHDDAPDSCQFTCGDTCGWTNETGWVSHNSSGWFLTLSDQKQRGRLTSRVGCSTGGAEHCLTFWYRFTDNYIVDLTVRVGESPDSGEELWKTDYTQNRRWNRAAVPFNTTTNFVVVMEADRYRPELKTHSVFVDAVEYFTSSCGTVPDVATLPTDPEDGIPCVSPTTTTTTTSTSSTEPATDTEETVSDSTGEFEQSTVSGAAPRSTPVSGVGGEGSAGSTESSVDDGDDGGSSSNAGVIAGAVIAVILVIVIAVAVVIFVFRKQLWAKDET